MKNTLRAAVVAVAFGSVVGFAQQQPPPPQVPSISQRPTGSSLGMIRVGAADKNIWFDWRVGMPAAAIKGLTFSQALAAADAYPISLATVVASSTQILSVEVPKPLDHRLQTGERNAVNYRLRELNEQVLAYRVDGPASDAATRRKVFEFAKAIRAATVVVPDGGFPLDEADKLAEEFDVNVAVESKTDPKAAMRAVEGRSKRVGIAADLGGWLQAGIKPVEALPLVKDRLLLVTAADRSALG